jgi:hypothetical protein
VRKRPGVDRAAMSAPGARRGLEHDRRAGARELSSPLSRMQRPCRGVRCEHKLTAAVSPMALASEAPRHGSVARVPPLSRMQSRWAPSWSSGLGLASASAALAGAHVRTSRASACKDQDAVTVARTAALRATHHPDGAGARAVVAEIASAPR